MGGQFLLPPLSLKESGDMHEQGIRKLNNLMLKEQMEAPHLIGEDEQRVDIDEEPQKEEQRQAASS